MPYSELIKNFERIRDYMRQFYVYGFKSRSEYIEKSARSYDNEKRRIESWLGNYLNFRHSAEGKSAFLSVDSRTIPQNPLYKAFKAKSFTDKDCTLYFYIMDILASGEALSVQEIVDRIDKKYLSCFEKAVVFDVSTVRKKLAKYEKAKIVFAEKRGKEKVFKISRSEIDLPAWSETLEFYSEADPLGVIGSFIPQKEIPLDEGYFRFKHHYILHALDSDILCELLLTMCDRRCVEVAVTSKQSSGKERVHNLYPMKIFISTQNGRQYLLGYHYIYHQPMFIRLDTVHSVKAGSVEKYFEKYMGYYAKLRENLWGVSLGEPFCLDRIEMVLYFEKGEEFIVRRLEREKRFGTAEPFDEHRVLFSADVYDAGETLTWLRTFIGRIESFSCSDKALERQFFDDIAAMKNLYAGDGHAV